MLGADDGDLDGAVDILGLGVVVFFSEMFFGGESDELFGRSFWGHNDRMCYSVSMLYAPCL